MSAPAMHLQAVGDAQRACETCGTLFKPKRPWSRFCRTHGDACRNAFHAAEARKAAIREAAEEMYEALLIVRTVIQGKDVAHIWLNAPDVPEVSLGMKIDQALAKAGWKPPKP